jgi:hypothetical protein
MVVFKNSLELFADTQLCASGSRVSVKLCLTGYNGLAANQLHLRLSTANAHVMLNMTGTRGQKRKQIIDEMSACLILQSYLDSPNSIYKEEQNG